MFVFMFVLCLFCVCVCVFVCVLVGASAGVSYQPPFHNNEMTDWPNPNHPLECASRSTNCFRVCHRRIQQRQYQSASVPNTSIDL